MTWRFSAGKSSWDSCRWHASSPRRMGRRWRRSWTPTRPSLLPNATKRRSRGRWSSTETPALPFSTATPACRPRPRAPNARRAAPRARRGPCPARGLSARGPGRSERGRGARLQTPQASSAMAGAGTRRRDGVRGGRRVVRGAVERNPPPYLLSPCGDLPRGRRGDPDRDPLDPRSLGRHSHEEGVLARVDVRSADWRADRHRALSVRVDRLGRRRGCAGGGARAVLRLLDREPGRDGPAARVSAGWSGSCVRGWALGDRDSGSSVDHRLFRGRRTNRSCKLGMRCSSS